MLKRGIKTYIPKKSKPTGKANYKNDFCPERFDYDSKQNFYICPAGKELHYSCYNKKNRVKRCIKPARIQRVFSISSHARADRSNLLHRRLLTPATVDGSLDKELSFQ